MEKKFNPKDIKIKLENDIFDTKSVEFKVLQSKFSFFDIKKLILNNGFCVKINSFKGNVVRYLDNDYDMFLKHFRYLSEITINITNFIDENELYLYNCENNWYLKNNILDLSSIKPYTFINNFYNGIKIDKDYKIINYLIEQSLKYNALILLMFDKSETIITLSDHMDIFIFTTNKKIINYLNFENIKYNFCNDFFSNN